MESINYRRLFCVEDGALEHALSEHKRLRAELAEAKTHRTADEAFVRGIDEEIKSHRKAIEDADARLVTAVGTHDEEKALEALREAQASLQKATDRFKAVSKRAKISLDGLERRLEDERQRATVALVPEVLAELEPNTYSILKHAYSVYEGAMRWPEFLVYIFPLDVRDLPPLRAKVEESYGLDPSLPE